MIKPVLSEEDIEEIKLAKKKDPKYIPPKGITRDDMWLFIEETLANNGLLQYSDIMSYDETYSMYNAIKIVDQKFKDLKQVMEIRRAIWEKELE